MTNADLDACHGHVHAIPWDGKYADLYHYHMTDEYPYTVGCFMGTPTSPLETSLLSVTSAVRVSAEADTVATSTPAQQEATTTLKTQ